MLNYLLIDTIKGILLPLLGVNLTCFVIAQCRNEKSKQNVDSTATTLHYGFLDATFLLITVFGAGALFLAILIKFSKSLVIVMLTFTFCMLIMSLCNLKKSTRKYATNLTIGDLLWATSVLYTTYTSLNLDAFFSWATVNLPYAICEALGVLIYVVNYYIYIFIFAINILIFVRLIFSIKLKFGNLKKLVNLILTYEESTSIQFYYFTFQHFKNIKKVLFVPVYYILDFVSILWSFFAFGFVFVAKIIIASIILIKDTCYDLIVLSILSKTEVEILSLSSAFSAIGAVVITYFIALYSSMFSNATTEALGFVSSVLIIPIVLSHFLENRKHKKALPSEQPPTE